jgi:hypothetical protein
VGVFRSQDDGKHFEQINGGLPGEPLAWRLRQTGDGSIFLVCCCAKPGGVWKLDETKSAWQRCDTGPVFADVRDLVVSEAKDNAKFLAVAVEGDAGGVFASTDGGASWRKALAGPMRTVDCSPDGKLWCAAGQSGLQRSMDGGTNWTPVREFPFPFINDVTINPRNPGEIWVGTGGCGIFKGF